MRHHHHVRLAIIVPFPNAAQRECRADLIAILRQAIEDEKISRFLMVRTGFFSNLLEGKNVERAFQAMVDDRSGRRAPEWSHFAAIEALPAVIAGYRALADEEAA